MQEAKSPDGRTWQVESAREHTSFLKSKAPRYIVATTILIVFCAVVAFYSTLIAILFGIVLLIWGLERVSYLLRPRIIARTDGPPQERLVWKATGRSRSQTLEQRVVQSIKRGTPENEPPGLQLIEL